MQEDEQWLESSEIISTNMQCTCTAQSEVIRSASRAMRVTGRVISTAWTRRPARSASGLSECHTTPLDHVYRCEVGVWI